MKFIETPEQLTVRLFDGVTSAGVYAGGLSCLRPVELKWRTESMYGLDLTGEPEEEGADRDTVQALTLAEIAKQLKAEPLITVFVDDPFDAVVYQYGNYGPSWVRLGVLAGYA